MVEYIGTPTASAAALVSTISTTSTTADPGGHDEGPHNTGSIYVASTAGSLGTFADEAGTPMVESIGLALQATINNTSDGQRVSNVDNSGNEGGGTVVPPE